MNQREELCQAVYDACNLHFRNFLCAHLSEDQAQDLCEQLAMEADEILATCFALAK